MTILVFVQGSSTCGPVKQGSCLLDFGLAAPRRARYISIEIHIEEIIVNTKFNLFIFLSTQKFIFEFNLKSLQYPGIAYCTRNIFLYT